MDSIGWNAGGGGSPPPLWKEILGIITVLVVWIVLIVALAFAGDDNWAPSAESTSPDIVAELPEENR